MGPITQQEIDRARDILAADPKAGRNTVAKALGVSIDRGRRIIDKAKAGGEARPISDDARPSSASSKPTETYEYSDWGNAVLVTKIVGERVITLDQLLKVCNFDADEWEVERYTVNKWDMGSMPRATGNDEDGWRRDHTKPIITELYQVKAWLRRKTKIIEARNEIDALLERLERRAPHYPKSKHSATRSGNMLELSLPDAHFGKLAWGAETGWQNYDTKIADATYREAFDTLLERTSGYKFDRVLLVPGNDFLNANNNENTTARGTPQSCDGRQHKTFRIACDTTIWSIERALNVAQHVDVLPIPGNHDPDVMLYLSMVIAAWFRNCDRVHIDNSPTQRKFYQWGDVGIMFTHKGGKGAAKAQRNRLLMATERREMWGNTKFNEIHTGDLHQVRLEEEFGVRVRILPSLCPPDAWHSSEGFVANLRSAEAYVWNKKHGLIGTAHYNVPDVCKQ